MRCEVRGQEGAAATTAAATAASTTTAVQVEVRVELAEVAKPETGSLAIVEATRRHDRNWGGPPEMTALRRSFAAPAYKSSFVLLSLLGLLLRINPTTGGICWSSISNGRCKELLSQGVTREDCCASNAAAATAYSDEDLDSGSLFFWRVLGGGVQCRPCRESCAEVKCEEGKKCVVRRGRPRCVCSPECKAPRGGGPVCGTDGRSYKSLCRLKKRACKKGSHELAVAYTGHCQKNADCTTIRCREGQTCLTEIKSGRPRCVTCTYRCPRKRERVRNRTHRDRDRDRDPSTTMLCATNNITYPSWCHIVKDACVTGFVLETRHAGPCNAYDTSPLYIEEDNTSSNYGVDLADEERKISEVDSESSQTFQPHRSLAST
ncbi:follistatin-A isoform X2 [Vespula pensylvanica]|uniref:follistatin-A isoform X2 n=1 Tax=Vespula pensylvanica TaxID=30213 RepID=UPI001CBA3CD7|nr:follistatin-A isoform X2 [Vespula pensylvanica]XP_050857263.1 follistatin-A isoform X2 [Vespula vulgaris]